MVEGGRLRWCWRVLCDGMEIEWMVIVNGILDLSCLLIVNP